MKLKLHAIATLLPALWLISTPAPSAAACIPGDDFQRQVNYRAGLGVHQNPGFSSPKLDLVENGGVVRISGTTVTDEADVIWQPISFPKAGFVAVGSQGEIRNLVACPQLPTGAVRTSVFSNTTDRLRYDPIEPDLFVSSFGQPVASPETISWQSFADSGFTEGQAVEQLSVNFLTRNTAVAVVSQNGLADDSIAARRYRIEYARRKNRWVINWVGTQWKCWPGRGHEDWSAELCN